MFLRLSFGRSLTCPSGKPLRLSKKYGRSGFAPAPTDGPMPKVGRKGKDGPALVQPRFRCPGVMAAYPVGADEAPFAFWGREGVFVMTSRSIKLAAASLAAIAIAGCTTSGFGTGQSQNGGIGVNFSWTETGATRGTMIAQLNNGQMFQGPFFQITSESIADYGPLWAGWGPGYGWGHGWGGRYWGYGWG